MAGKSQVATRGRDDDLDVIGEGWREERGLLEDGVVSAEPDMLAGVDAEPRDVLLEVAQFDSRFAEFVQRLEMDVVSFGMWPVLVISKAVTVVCRCEMSVRR